MHTSILIILVYRRCGTVRRITHNWKCDGNSQTGDTGMSVASFSTTSSRAAMRYLFPREAEKDRSSSLQFHTSDGRWVKTLMVRQREGYAACQSSHRVCLFGKRFSESVFNVYFFPNYFPLSGLDLLYDYSRSSLGSRSNLTEGSRSTISGSTIDLEDRF